MNIYFNRCFTQTAKVIELLQNNPNGEKFTIFISHSSPNNYLEAVADHFEIEPKLSGQEYVDYILQFCRTHNIDVFIPRKNMELLAKHQDEFEKIGVKTLFIGTEEIYTLLNDKVATYQDLEGTDIVKIPSTYTITTYEEFQKAYEEITSMGEVACMKPISGIGGDGFKIIRENVSEVDELYTTTGANIAKSRVDRVLQSVDNIEPFMMSVFMEDEEYSIDCLGKDGELIVGVPRRKIDRYRNNIEYREELMEIARQLTKRYNLSALYNIQVRYHKGEPYLIEINTRMSGGMYKSCFAGVNFPYLAVQALRGEDVKAPDTLHYDFQMYMTNHFEFKALK
ncbi:carboxylate--amine ligase [Bacillus sp. M6-12]|uniref:ATP-grasp domain-containing protein n=1 Tax=Bacillus sp. M6-12 TaxID=2054166 RepID=UPI000C787756|nr:ATP-grasp domain-containing protein [Bacillus sp. M6-12]PLS18841.1 carboxylate--amine ligase [Bacillus sp. M6-12]